MAFDPITWFLGFAFSRTATKGIERFTSKTLERELDNAMNKWSKKLPKEIRFTYMSLFDNKRLQDEQAPPSVTELAKLISEGKIPRKEDWQKALLYLWRFNKETLGDEANTFFLLEEEKALTHITDLAEDLERVCIDNEKLFQSMVIYQIDEVLSQQKEFKSLLKQNQADEFLINLGFAEKYDKLKQSLFAVEMEKQSCLGVSISNSGLIVCSGRADKLVSITAMKSGKECDIEKHVVNGPYLHFISIKQKTNGLVPRYSFDGKEMTDRVFTFDKEGNTVTGKIFNLKFLFFDLITSIQKSYPGFIPINLDSEQAPEQLTSCPVFNQHLEFVGLGIIATKGSKITGGDKEKIMLLALSWEAFFQYMQENPALQLLTKGKKKPKAGEQ